MGCGLRKMKPLPEENSPGKIYSTLKRPQVETKVGVAYTYRYLDFLIGRDGGTSTLRLSSVRELPAQLEELYQQGFVLAAVHPFVHPCGPQSNSPQHQLYRAILLRLADGAERNQLVCPSYRLQLEECLSSEQVPTPELIQGYVKKQIQDAADQGVMFVGFVQEPYGAPCSRTREPHTPSLSLHSSPSSVLGSLGSRSPSDPSSPTNEGGPPPEAADKEEEEEEEEGRKESGSGMEESASSAASPLSTAQSPSHNNNTDGDGQAKDTPAYRPQRGHGAELLALYNHPPLREGQVKYYTVKVPLRVQNCEEGVKGVEANWLDHMTQHFNNGASLVDGYFHLGDVNDPLPKSVESVFIFQEASESEPNAGNPTYDAIVVEQWTIIDGLQVKADYVPLLQSLATFGWRLTCVLPTPIIKTNSDGSLSTKQIVFLQRPVLGRKRRESKKLIFKPRGKSNKNLIKDTAKGKKKKKSKAERETEEPKILDEREREEGEGEGEKSGNAAETASGGDDTKTGGGDGAEAQTKDGGNEGEEPEGPKQNGELLATEAEPPEATETVAIVETESATKEEEVAVAAEAEAEAEAAPVLENGVETDEEGDGGAGGEELSLKCKTEEANGGEGQVAPTNQE